MATCGIAAGARPVLAAFMDEVEKRSLQDVVVAQTGCIGVCRLEPIVEIYKPGQNKVTYVKVTPEMVARIVTEHVVNDRVVDEYTIGYSKQIYQLNPNIPNQSPTIPTIYAPKGRFFWFVFCFVV